MVINADTPIDRRDLSLKRLASLLLPPLAQYLPLSFFQWNFSLLLGLQHALYIFF